MPLHPNLGTCPPHAKGKRVHVVLRGGYATRGREPAGWAADARREEAWLDRDAAA